MARIIVNPKVFSDRRDALCVAWNEAFRIVMEMNGFDPVSEPTQRQRKFFADTDYASDENMLRRTILARICTFDTSVDDPTQEQLEESLEFLHTVLRIGAPTDQSEQSTVQRIIKVLELALEKGTVTDRKGPVRPVKSLAGTEADVGGGDSDEEKLRQSGQAAEPEKPQETDDGRKVNPDGSYELTSGSGSVVRYDADGNYLGESDPSLTGVVGDDPKSAQVPGATLESSTEAAKAVNDKAGPVTNPGSVAKPGETPQEQQQAQQAAPMVPGLKVSGSRNNIFEYNGRRISSREAARLQESALANQPAQPGQQAQPGQPQAVALPQGLTVSGSRKNIFEYNGRRVSSREAQKIIAGAQQNAGSRAVAAAAPQAETVQPDRKREKRFPFT